PHRALSTPSLHDALPISDEEIVSNPQPGRAGARRIEIVPDFNVQSILLSGVSVTIMDASGGEPVFQRGAYSELWPTEEDIQELLDRKSTRLNSSHVKISY